MPNTASQVVPTLTGGTTDALVYDQGYTYDQPGLTYDQASVAYGGIYNTNQDIVPLVSLASNVVPTISGYSDIYTGPEAPLVDTNVPIGPGFFMFITYVN